MVGYERDKGDAMVALAFCGDLRYCPYMERYLERIRRTTDQFKIYFWNRSGDPLTLDEHYDYYGVASRLNKKKVEKLKDFYQFGKWLGNRLDTDKPDKVIALSTLTGILLKDRLKKKYAGRYIFDIRDYSYEHLPGFRKAEKELVDASYFTAISSKGFERFLPVHDYVIAHNFNRDEAKTRRTFQRADGTIHLVFNGMLRYFSYQKLYLDLLGNDERFKMLYHGDGPEMEQYREYCGKNRILNVEFTGRYDNAQKPILLSHAHILNNCYGNPRGTDKQVKYAVSNKFYDGIIYHIPQLVEPDGYKAMLTEEYGIGFALRPEKGLADKLYETYMKINGPEFDARCEDALKKVMEEDDRYISKIDAFLKW